MLLFPVDSCLNRCHLPSPPSTYLVSYRGLSTIQNPLVKRAVVLRIMRYVSFHAWGSLRSDADRRRKSVELVLKNLWTPDPFAAKITPFVAGGGVWWIPAVIGPKELKLSFHWSNKAPTVESGETIGWIACRQPPLKRTWMEDGGRGKPLWVDITDEVVAKLRTKHESRGQKLAVLWDCRFLLHFDIDKIPPAVVRGVLDEGDRLMVHPQTRWYLPVVMHSQAKLGVERIVHNTLSTSNQGLVPLDRDTIASWRSYTTIEAVTSRWIEITWVRSLSGL